jgi:putative hydrolase of the HAD superfamily
MAGDANGSGRLTMRPTAITLDYWDTIYAAVSHPDRRRRRQDAVRRLLAEVGHDVQDADVERLYRASQLEADRWWRDEHRGYTTADRLRWMLARLAVERPDDCEHVTRAVTDVDASLVDVPPPLLPGAGAGLQALAARFRLAIVSDTGFASGRAQDRLLEQDGLRALFAVTVYSMDVGHAKPRREPFARALSALGMEPADVVHVGDNERTDVEGALAAGMRAVRLDLVRAGGSTAAEYVATSFDDLVRYLAA